MTKATYKVGDKVRILVAKNIMYGVKYWGNGDVAKVKLVDSDGDLIVESTKLKGESMMIGRSEFKYIEKVEESDAKMTQFKVGDKVLINGLSRFGKDYIGKVGKVYRSVPDVDGDIGVKVEGFSICILPSKVELVSPKPTKKQRLTTLEQKVEAMQAEIDALKAAKKLDDVAETFGIKRQHAVPKLTPNEQRKAIIDEAKAFVEVTLAEVDEQMGWQTTSIPVYKKCGHLRIEFITNAEKRTVVALARYGNILEDPTVIAKGIAKCAPGDVFNADIGKAIALGRALGLDVERFEKAVQPPEFVAGMFVKDYGDDIEQLDERYPEEDGEYGDAFNIVGHGYWLGTTQLTQILDDTEAQY